MKIAIIGAGAIGSTLAQRLAGAGHDVTIANSRAPETVDAAALSTGARAAWAADVTAGAEVVVVSVSLVQVPDVAAVVRSAPSDAVVVDTSNYYPQRDGVLPGFEDGDVESLWVQTRYGRPVAKAWNSVLAASFAEKGSAPGAAGRVALPVAADDDAHRATAMALVEDTGFDAVDAGALATSWRQQPGAPAYCTDLTAAELLPALAAAEASRSPLRRDLVGEVVTERAEAGGAITGDYLLALNRAVY
ncbi:predicted dinucleotide-binding enzyme [Sanguibacter keddieii DSM 10542]|uniref:Predicted dinucleotide-binding enzyme n=2 Tax=Sanguibacter keddieii TaxID=60920 RepID=D1BAW1_SANKS|nr:predicted dinucleotide-binding enzyme [Sanguibacter keddieii DSM 10542]